MMDEQTAAQLRQAFETDDEVCIGFGPDKLIGYDDAMQSEADIPHERQQFMESMAFWFRVSRHRPALERLVARHLGVHAARVKMSHLNMWRQGAFNVAIPMLVFDTKAAADAAHTPSPQGDMPPEVPDSLRRVMLRLPMPPRCAEAVYPGSILEKMRCETATYVWMQKNCSQIRIPHLFGLGFPDGTHWFASWMRWPLLSNYVAISVPQDECPVDSGYMILEHFGASFGQELSLMARDTRIVEDGVEYLPEPIQMLAQPAKMRNLFRGVSRIILALARVPQPRIGAFRFNDDGTISLDNRPVTADMFVLENARAPRTMSVDTTYTNVNEYVSDLQTFQEQKFLAAPNAAVEAADATYQMGIMAFLRAVTHHFVGGTSRWRNGPFVLYMSDANASNFMVDENWNVTGMYDLEWMFSAPADMPRVPSWLTWSSVDRISNPATDEYAAYNEARAAFAEVFAEEERLADTAALETALGGTTLSAVMEESWASKTFWFYSSLLSITGMTHVASHQILPMFVRTWEEKRDASASFADLAKLWSTAAADVIVKKVDDHTRHLVHVAALFGRAPPTYTASHDIETGAVDGGDVPYMEEKLSRDNKGNSKEITLQS
ncbi:hypothetical protein SPBR_06900 [Sporothrix brasiliensis 5110]|uniref:Aminoglycoside phosphotransferase domain-containing protein n=1 Tax=Sporothrix brasiliensis 5110 TaxID=1398154 RepID=A0A0C2IGC1_9PEZI|nr:uncharacterized protein SPBR_06900 [Sporothrix brasiliensis 5110]KIH88236.1 hypothetical protein SPBR_06900 [Sporothrix brasiliensis 5110]